MHSGAPIDILFITLLAVLFVGAAMSDHRRKVRELEEE